MVRVPAALLTVRVQRFCHPTGNCSSTLELLVLTVDALLSVVAVDVLLLLVVLSSDVVLLVATVLEELVFDSVTLLLSLVAELSVIVCSLLDSEEQVCVEYELGLSVNDELEELSICGQMRTFRSEIQVLLSWLV